MLMSRNSGPKYTPLGWTPRSRFSSFRARVFIGLVSTLMFLLFVIGTNRPWYPWPRASQRLLPEVSYESLQAASPGELTQLLEQAKHRLLMRTGFSPATMSKSLRAPLFTSNQLTFSPDTRGYESRIQEARGSFPGSDDWRKSTAFPYNIFTTDKNITNLPPQFEMWSLLNQSINIPDFPEPPHRDWDLSIADDDYMDRQVAEWVGTTGRWADLWAKLHTIPSPVLRADVYRYMAMLFEGGIYADSDTAPLSHPFTWGRDAPSIVPVEVEDILDLLHGRSEGSLLEGINMVTAIECDNSFAMNLRKWRTWTRQIARVFVQPCSRSLQFPQYMLVSKPHHPVFIDTLEAVHEQVYAADYSSGSHKGALDLTGPGPYSDAMFRHLLINYGVRPEHLRRMTHPVRVGDVLILPAESFLARSSSVERLADWNKEYQDEPWYWGYGWWDWFEGSTKVVYHGLAGRWRGKGFD